MKEVEVVQLPQDEMPTQWFNILPTLAATIGKLPEPKDPDEGESRLKKLPEYLVGECLNQEFSEKTWVDIPEGIQNLYQHVDRPRPLFRARHLEEKLKTPARIYWKAESFSPTGSHKTNTALAQAYYAAKEGYTRLVTETGAGQWGTALSHAASLNDLDCTVYWVRDVYDWKKDRRNLMKFLGAKVFASPSKNTEVGRELLKEDSNHRGSLGIAISEGIEDALRNKDDTRYCLGSVLNHVLLHQTVIGLEAKKQLEMIDEKPDVVTGCFGGGSNFGGISIPFVADVLNKKAETKFVAAQNEAAPSLVRGEYKYDFADYAEKTPMLKMYTLGHKTKTKPIKADGIRYNGGSPIFGELRNHGIVSAVAFPSDERYVFERAKLFTQTEGWLPAPESAHGIAYAIDRAVTCKRTGKPEVILVNVSGHGFLDIPGYREKLGKGISGKISPNYIERTTAPNPFSF